MSFLRYKPGEPLGRFVDCLWYFHGTRPTRELVLPTGTTELVINLRDDYLRVYSAVSDVQGHQFRGAVLSGVQSRYVVLGPSAQLTVIGVHFRPGGAAPFLRMPLSEVADRHVSLEQLWGTQAIALREGILEANSPRGALSLLEEALIDRLSGSRPRHPVVEFALRQFAGTPDRARVDEVLKETGYSPKRFIRVFVDEVGLPPKRFCRILRLQALVNRLASGGKGNWAEVALDGGYYDQSHLIREFRALTGLTPARYSPVDSDTPNHVAV